MGFNGLLGVWHRLRAGAVRSRRALLAALGFDETRDRGVKNCLNFRGVIDGFRRSFPRLGGSLGGDVRRLLLSTAEFLAEAGVLFSMFIVLQPSLLREAVCKTQRIRTIAITREIGTLEKDLGRVLWVY
jgi:hypothetical protein